ncbi:unnamed protein product, partial [Amoebophrya sp. A25]
LQHGNGNGDPHLPRNFLQEEHPNPGQLSAGCSTTCAYNLQRQVEETAKSSSSLSGKRAIDVARTTRKPPIRLQQEHQEKVTTGPLSLAS